MSIFSYNSEDEIFVGENRFYNFSEAAKLIGKKGLGRNNLFKLLKENGILDEHNQPINTVKYKSFFRVVDNRHLTTLISTYGINYIKKYLV